MVSLTLYLLSLWFASDVADLGHPAFGRREAATRRLKAAGVLARPTLDKVLLHSDPEVRMRVERLCKESVWLLRIKACRTLTAGTATATRSEGIYWCDARRLAALRWAAFRLYLTLPDEIWVTDPESAHEVTVLGATMILTPVDRTMGVIYTMRSRAHGLILKWDTTKGPWLERYKQNGGWVWKN